MVVANSLYHIRFETSLLFGSYHFNTYNIYIYYDYNARFYLRSRYIALLMWSFWWSLEKQSIKVLKRWYKNMSKRGDNIHKRSDGRWEGRYYKGRRPNGSIIYGSVYGKSYSEVKEKLKSNTKKQFEKIPTSKNDIIFADVANMWINDIKIRLKAGSINKYQRIIDTHIIKDFGNMNIGEITSTVINQYISEKLISGRVDGKGGLSPSYTKNIIIVINSILNYASKENLCLPLSSSVSKPYVPKRELSIISKTTQRKLEDYILNNITPTNVGIYISLYSGLRIGEICALQWNDIDFVNSIIHIRHTISRIDKKIEGSSYRTSLIMDSPKTQSSKRDIPISANLYKILVELYNVSTSEFVISDTDGFISPRTYDYRFHGILKKCGIESFNYHTLRHTFATRCVEAGVDVKSLSEILGHANVNITLNFYVHSSMEMKRMQLEKVIPISVNPNICGQKNGIDYRQAL